MTPQEIRDMLLTHDRAITTMQTYFKVMVGFGVVTLPCVLYLVFNNAFR